MGFAYEDGTGLPTVTQEALIAWQRPTTPTPVPSR